MKDRNALRQEGTKELEELATYERITQIDEELGLDESPIVGRAMRDSRKRLRAIDEELARDVR